MMQSDVTQTVQFRRSATWMFLLVVGGICMTVFLFFATASARAAPNHLLQLFGWLVVIAVCALSLSWIRRSAELTAPIVTLSPGGISDIRISPDLVPWTSVEKLIKWNNRLGVPVAAIIKIS